MVKQGKLPLEGENPRLSLAMQDEGHLSANSPPSSKKSTRKKDAKIESTEAEGSTAGVVDPKIVGRPQLRTVAEVDPENAEMTVGGHLRHEREQQGFSLHDIAEKLRLRPRQLQALEEGDYDSLPGQTFVVGFIRSYANTLGLDAVAVVALYKNEHSGDAAPELTFPEPTSEGRMPRSGLLIGSLFVAVLLVAGWYYYLNEKSIDLEIVSELPQRLVAKVTDAEGADTVGVTDTSDKEVPTGDIATEEPVQTVAPMAPVEPAPLASTDLQDAPSLAKTVTDENGTAPVLDKVAENKRQAEQVDTNTAASKEPENLPDAREMLTGASAGMDGKAAERSLVQAEKQNDISPEQASSASKSSAVSVPVDVGTQSLPSPDDVVTYPQQKLALVETKDVQIPRDAPASDPVNLGVENSDARLVLVARQESWVQIIGAGGDVILDRVLRAGDTFMLPTKDNMTLTTANASGLEIRLDGKRLGSLGGYGEILRDLPLNPDQLKEVLATIN